MGSQGRTSSLHVHPLDLGQPFDSCLLAFLCVCASLCSATLLRPAPQRLFDAGTWLNCPIKTTALQDLSWCIHKTHTQTHKQKNQVIWVFTETITTTQTVDRGAASVAEFICTACQQLQESVLQVLHCLARCLMIAADSSTLGLKITQQSEIGSRERSLSRSRSINKSSYLNSSLVQVWITMMMVAS